MANTKNKSEAPIRLLVLDDDEVDFRHVKRLLDNTVKITWESEPVAAKERLEAEQFDAMLLDYRLGPIDGVTFLRELRAAGHAIPVIMLTGCEDDAVDRAALAAGAEDFLVKGRLDAGALRRSLRYALARSRSTRDLNLLKAALDHGPYGEAIIQVEADESAKLIYANPAYQEITGFSLTQLRHRPVSALFGPASDAGQRVAFTESLLSGTPFQCEEMLCRADGGQFAGSLELKQIADESNASSHRVLVLRDVSKRRAREEQLRHQANMLDLAHEAIIAQDLEGRIIYWNNGAARLLGIQESQAVGESFAEVLGLQGRLCDARRTTALDGFWEGELTAMKPGGDPVPLKSHWTLMGGDGDDYHSILTINADISEQRRLQEQVERNQRMEAIGSLAAGVAHDLNNIFAPIIMGTSLFDLEQDVPESLKELRTIIEQNAHRGAQIVKQLLSFARGNQEERTVVQLRHLSKEVLSLARETFDPAIKITVDMPRDLWPVNGNPTQFHQVLLNLAVNARDAMPEGGNLIITGANAQLDAAAARAIPGSRPGCYTTVTVSDTGTGIDPAIQDKVFDLFFTTKPEDKGTGLGMATIKGIVDQYHGWLKLESEMGEGTQITFAVPAEVDGIVEETAARKEMKQGHGETILVVDDEVSIRSVVDRTLRNNGYNVLTAKDGIEGLQIFSEHVDEIAAVLSDVLMPDSNGPAMVSAMRRLNPDVRVLFCSGASSRTNTDAVPAWRKQLPDVPCLEKPFDTASLLGSLQETLHARLASERARRY